MARVTCYVVDVTLSGTRIIKEWGMFYHSNVTRTCWKFHFDARAHSRAYLDREEVVREYLKQLEFSHVLASTQRTRVNNTNLLFETHSATLADEKEKERERERRTWGNWIFLRHDFFQCDVNAKSKSINFEGN